MPFWFFSFIFNILLNISIVVVNTSNFVVIGFVEVERYSLYDKKKNYFNKIWLVCVMFTDSYCNWMNNFIYCIILGTLIILCFTRNPYKIIKYTSIEWNIMMQCWIILSVWNMEGIYSAVIFIFAQINLIKKTLQTMLFSCNLKPYKGYTNTINTKCDLKFLIYL